MVTLCNNERLSLDLNNRNCTCRSWEISGISCCHAISCIVYQIENPMDYVHPLLKKSAFQCTYMPIIFPVPSFHHWDIPETHIGGNHPIEQPSNRRRGGRPISTRFKSIVFDFIGKGKSIYPVVGDKPTRMRRFCVIIECRSCEKVGHNIKNALEDKQ